MSCGFLCQMYAVIVSRKDPAGLNIKEALLSNFCFRRTANTYDNEPVYEFGNILLFTTQKESIHCEDIDKDIQAEAIIFATTHKSQQEIKALCVHVPGNWGKAELGGKDRELCIAPAAITKLLFVEIVKLAENSGYEPTLEVTHHGPYLANTPSCFIELGSTAREWQDKHAASIIARAIVFGLEKKPEELKTAIGIGGGHYAPYFSKIMLLPGIAVAHICPKYNLGNLDYEMLEKAIQRSQPKPKLILLDWKGLAGFKQKVQAMAKKTGLKVERCRKFKQKFKY